LDGARQTVGPEALDSGFGLAVPVRLPYPPAALARGQAGRARIEMEIEPTGRVARVTVLDETAGWGFGDAARQGYVRARFTPPTVQARPVRVLLRKTIEFLP
jgi:TonB family protein